MVTPARVDDYRLDALLGEGLTGEVFLATLDRRGPPRQVVVKVCHPIRAVVLPAAETLVRELDPRVVQYEALGDRGEGWSGWYATCRLQPKPYASLLETTSLEQRLTFMRRTAEAVALLHAAGVVHGDLRPSNVLARSLRSGKLEPLITDVGVSPRYDPGFHDRPEHAVRLYPFLAPEVILPFRGGSPPTLEPPADVYGLGALLCALLTGQGPGTSEGERTAAEILAAKERRGYFLAALLEPGSQVDLGILDRLLRRSLDPDPAARPTAIRFADGVAACLSLHDVWEEPAGR